MPEDRTAQPTQSPHRRLPRPRRVIAHLLIFLLLGAIVNGAVAWGLALRPLPDQPRRFSCYPCHRSGGIFVSEWPGELHIKEDPAWALFGYPSRIPQFVSRDEFLQRVPGDSLFGSPPPEGLELPLPEGTWSERATGMPVLALCYRAYEQRSGGTPAAQTFGCWQLRSAVLGDLRSRLPLLPLWSGFAINTLLYGVLLWLLFFGLGFTRRAIRRRRGLCPACAYPRGDSLVCTECGRPLAPRAASAAR